MSRGWKLLNKKLVYPQHWAGVEAWRVRLPNQEQHTFYINRGMDFVMVCAFTDDNKVVLLRQYYVGQLKKVPALVAGYIDPSEKPIQAARRELLEETGYRARRVASLGTSIKGKYTTGLVHHFVALGVEKVAEQKLEKSEDIEVVVAPLTVFKKLLQQHKLTDAFAEVCGWRALNYLKI